MIYVLLGMSLLFVAIGFIVTENNAKYLLSGYNTMSEVERNKVDLKSYIPSFRKFHVWLGISFFIFGLILYFIDENAIGLFLAAYPIVAYMFFLLTNTKYSKGFDSKWKVTLAFLLGTLIFVMALFAIGNKENKLIFSAQQIEIQGNYGEQLSPTEILSIELVNQLPKITLRTNGYSSGSIKKGYFKTIDGEIIKLILNSDTKPYILVTKRNGNKIYFAAKKESTEKIFNEMKKTLPDTEFKQ